MTHVMVCASRGVDTHQNIQSGHEQRHTISFQAISQKNQRTCFGLLNACKPANFTAEPSCAVKFAGLQAFSSPKHVHCHFVALQAISQKNQQRNHLARWILLIYKRIVSTLRNTCATKLLLLLLLEKDNNGNYR